MDSASTAPSPHLSQILNELADTVTDLRGRLRSSSIPSGWDDCDDEDLEGKVTLVVGYTIAMHRGLSVFEDGDSFCGLPVKIDRSDSRVVSLEADKVRLGRWDEELQDWEWDTFYLTASTRW
jgi:hypothetical protein